jgi:hypothetical protein
MTYFGDISKSDAAGQRKFNIACAAGNNIDKASDRALPWRNSAHPTGPCLLLLIPCE